MITASLPASAEVVVVVVPRLLGRSMLASDMWLAVIACAGVALLQVAIGLAARHVERPAMLSPSRRTTLLQGLAVVALTCVVGARRARPATSPIAGTSSRRPTARSRGWRGQRLQQAAGRQRNDRYQYWQAAGDAQASHPWGGIGPGTFEFWWARHGMTPSVVRDAHSLYFETLAERGSWA